MFSPAKQISSTKKAGLPGSLQATRAGGWTGRHSAGILALGAAGLLIGGLPPWGGHRIPHPMGSVASPVDGSVDIDMGPDVSARRVAFESLSGDPLGGWFVPAPEGTERPWPAVVLVHGYGG